MSDPADEAMAQTRTPEEQLENMLLSRRRGLEEQVARLRENVADLERREKLLRDSRAAVERALRVGAHDLDLRESELATTLRSVADHEDELRANEAAFARRRSQLGAVELKREAVEQRERTLAEREEHLAGRESALTRVERSLVEVVALAFVPGVAYRLVEIEPSSLSAGGTIEHESTDLTVARIGPSPLPADDRRCAYLVANSP